MRKVKTIMVAVTLLSVEPTDRALTGWMPFGQYLDRPMNRLDPAGLLDYLTDVGAT
jgi:hypothetical protein